MNRFLKWTGISLITLIVLSLAVIYGLSEYRLTRSYNHVPLTAINVPNDPASVTEGERLVGIYHCGSCHAARYQGSEFINVPGLARIVAPNLTLAIPTYSDRELARLVRHAVKRDGSNATMFASDMYTAISDEDLGKMIAYYG